MALLLSYVLNIDHPESFAGNPAERLTACWFASGIPLGMTYV
jgi:hypothetical protein